LNQADLEIDYLKKAIVEQKEEEISRMSFVSGKNEELFEEVAY